MPIHPKEPHHSCNHDTSGHVDRWMAEDDVGGMITGLVARAHVPTTSSRVGFARLYASLSAWPATWGSIHFDPGTTSTCSVMVSVSFIRSNVGSSGASAGETVTSTFLKASRC